MDVSVLICTMPERKRMFASLYARLDLLKDSVDLHIELLYDDTLGITIGEKRNLLLQRAAGRYCCFVDDDDGASDAYFTTYETAIKSGVDYDCVALNGHYYLNGKYMKPFFHALKYGSWHDDQNGYYRCPNHLNLIKTDICRQIGYLKLNFGEDQDFSERLLKSGLLKNEYAHDNVLYLYYKVDTPKHNDSVKPVKRKMMMVYT